MARVFDRFLTQVSTYGRNPYFLVIIALTGIGLFLRMLNLGYDPVWVDEATSILAARGLLENGVPILPSGQEYDRAILSTYTIAASIKLFGNSEFAARLPSAILGALAIPLTFLLGKRTIGANASLIATFFLTFSLFEIAWSRQARMYQLFQTSFLLVLVGYLYLRESLSLGRIVLFLVGIVGSYFSHEIWKIVLPILLFDLLVSYKPKNSTLNVSKYVFLAGLFVYVILVIVRQSLVVPGWVFGLLGDEIRVKFSGFPIAFLLVKHTTLVLLAVLGSVLLLIRDRGSGSLGVGAFWLSLFILSYFGDAMLPTAPKGWFPRYLHFMMPLLLLLSAYGTWWLVVKVLGFLERRRGLSASSSAQQRDWRDSTLAAVVISVVIVLTPFVSDVRLKFNNLSEINEPQPNYRDAAFYVKDKMTEQDVIITNRPPLVYYYLGKVTYRGNTFFTFEQDGRKLDVYTGAEIIESEDGLKEIISGNPKGWIMFNDFMPLVGKDWIKDHLSLYREVPSTLDDQTVYIYFWDANSLKIFEEKKVLGLEVRPG